MPEWKGIKNANKRNKKKWWSIRIQITMRSYTWAVIKWRQKCCGGRRIQGGNVMENDMILKNLKLLSVPQKQHLLSRLKNQHEHETAKRYVRDYNLALITAMRVNSS